MKIALVSLLVGAIGLSACTAQQAQVSTSLGLSASCAASAVAYAAYRTSHPTPKTSVEVAYAVVRSICEAPPEARAAMVDALASAVANFDAATKK